MEPTKPPEHNWTYFGPEGTDILPLEVARDVDGRTVSSAWRPSEEELVRLNAGGSVRLTVWMMPPPPVAIDVCGPANDNGEEAVWHGDEIGYTWAEAPAEAADDDAQPGLGMDGAGEKPHAADVADGDASVAASEDDSSTER